MKKVDHLVARAFKSAMAFVLAVGLCPVAPAMAQEGVAANEEGDTAAAAVDGADASTDGTVAGATGDVAGSEADGVQPGGVSGDGDAAAGGAGVGAPAQDVVENDVTGSDVSTDVAEAAAAADGEADESNDAAAQTDGWQAWGGCEWMIDAEGCLTIRPKDGAGVGQLPNVAGYAPWCASEYNRDIEAVRVENGVKASEYAGGLFPDLSLVETMDLSGLDVSSATSVSWMFSNCSSLVSLDLSDWDTSKVAGMNGMFLNCPRLASLGVSGWDTSSVTGMSGMFCGCSSLTSLDASNWDTSCVTDMASMFSGCSVLVSLDLSSWDASNVGGMEGMFYACLRLEQIAVGDGFDLCRVTVDPSLVEGWTGKWVNQAGDAFPIAAIPSGTKDVYRAQIALHNDMFEVDCSDSPYTGSEITKEIRSPKLQEGVDYEVSYSDNVSAGTASISICGIGRAVGTLHYEFNITKKSPTFDAPAPLDATYGQKLADLMLPEGFSWQDGDIVVDWYGKKTLFVRFTPNDQANYNSIDGIPVDVIARHKDLKTAETKFEGSPFEYTGRLVEPNPTIAMDGEPLVEGVDYSVEYRNNVLPGKAEALVCGMGRFAGSFVGVSFDIVRSAGNCIALPGHWATGSGGWWYPYDNGGYPANEWCIIDGSYYHFNGSGYMQMGWLNLGGTWYYLSGSGIMQTGWQKIGGSWYWFDDSGAMASGWKQIGGTYYHFNGSGVMQTGWLSTGGVWYYPSDSGVMATGWQTIGGERYHFDSSGAMASGWSVVDGLYFFFDGSGAMQTGWLNRGGAWYWLGSSGVMATGWQTIDGAKYWFDDSGVMATGWKWIDGSCYYFDGSGVMQADKRIDGSYVDSDGRWVQNA